MGGACERGACTWPMQVLWCGDLNVCHLDEDIWNVGAKHLEKSAGTTKAERQSFADGLAQVCIHRPLFASVLISRGCQCIDRPQYE